MVLNPNFVILGSLITLAGGLTYVIDTLKGRIQPNKVSWFLWSLAPFVAFAAEINQSVGLQSLLTFSVGFIPFIVFVSSFVNKKSFWKLSKIDIICGVLSLTGLILWFITKVGNIAILFCILADGLASFPTLIKAYTAPETESYYVFSANAISSTITLLTIKNWNFQTFGFPLYLLIMMGAIAVFIKFKLGRFIKLQIKKL